MASVASTSLGSSLRQERLQRNLGLAAIASQTRISMSILEAIEADRFDEIPGGAYRRLFIRQYARALGVDPEVVVAEYLQQYEEPPLPLPKPPTKRRSRLWADAGWAVTVLACMAAAHHLVQNPVSWMKHHDWASVRLESILKTERQGRADRVAEPPPAAVMPPATGPAQNAGPSQEAPSQAAPVNVAFAATEPVWLSVKCDGNTVYTGVLEALKSKTFEAKNAVTASIGNAGGITVTLNGKPLGPLGAHGEVKTIELTLNGARRISHHVVSNPEATVAPQL